VIDLLQFFGLLALWGLLATIATIICGTIFGFWWKWMLQKMGLL